MVLFRRKKECECHRGKNHVSQVFLLFYFILFFLWLPWDHAIEECKLTWKMKSFNVKLEKIREVKFQVELNDLCVLPLPCSGVLKPSFWVKNGLKHYSNKWVTTFRLLFCFSMHVTTGIGLQKCQSSQVLVISQEHVTQVRSLTEQLSQSGSLILSSKSRKVIYSLTVHSKSKTKLFSLKLRLL